MVGGTLSAISACLLDWVQEIEEGYKEDPSTKKILELMGKKDSSAQRF